MSEWKQLYAEVLDREPPASLSLRVSILAAEADADEAGVGGSRRVVIGLVAAAATVAMLVILALAAQSRSSAPAPAKPDIPTLGPATNGWLAAVGGDQIYLVRAGEKARRLKAPGSAGASVACPAWSPDGTRLLFGRVTGSSQTGSTNADLVIVPVGSDGAMGAPKVIALDGFKALKGFDAQPCGTWSPDGRWIALAGTGAVWVVDTQTQVIRRLPDLRPSDLEWRPGTDELAIAGDTGTDRALSTPVTIYSTATSELSNLGSVKAAHITWSPDGTTLAYTGGEADFPKLWLVDSDGGNERLLVAYLGSANHGIGPVWSPTGDRIAYQRLLPGRGEAHEVVLVNVADGTQKVIAPPATSGSEKWRWYPRAVWWSPDGETLVYAAWSEAPFDWRPNPDIYGGYSVADVPGRSGPVGDGVIAVPADRPNAATVLIGGGIGAGEPYAQWSPIQMWGRQPE